VITSLQLGKKSFPVNLIQGPLAGISCAPFRLLTWEYGKPAFTCTEMISCKTIIHQPKLAQDRYLKKDPNEGPVCFQLAGNDPAELAEATQRVTDAGADLIDLNCGCPVNKIRQKGAGSRLLTDAPLLYKLISAMKQNTHLPVSIKIRVEGKSADKFNYEIAKVVMEAGADFLVVHGRHWTEHYETPCQHEQIRFFVENVKIPVIGNGDISDVDSLKTMLSTGCAGVMIARAGVGQPWLIKKLIAEMRQEIFMVPVWNEIGEIFLEHVNQLVNLLGNEKRAILQARQFAKYYARGLGDRVGFCEAVNRCENLLDLVRVCGDYF
jgi:tRNA-dihydrouridine synthase B